MKNPIIVALALVVVLANLSCQQQTETKDKVEVIEDTLNADQKLRKDIKMTRQAFLNVPSPVETIRLLREAGPEKVTEYLNPIEKADSYKSVESIAMNIGVYSADLTYLALYDNPQKALMYLAALNEMAKEIDILNNINQSIFDSMESNIENKDSLLDLISETFIHSNSKLFNNGRDTVTALVYVGVCMESLHIVSESAKLMESKHEIIENIIWHRMSMELLLSLLNNYTEKKEINVIIPEIKRVMAVFDAIHDFSETKTTVTPEEFNLICVEISGLRNKIVNETLFD